MADTTLFPSIIPDDPDEDDARDRAAIALENDECPWCDGEFDNVPAHASQAHPDEWGAYQEAQE